MTSAGLPGSISTISNGKRHRLVSARGKKFSTARLDPRPRARRPGDDERTLAPHHQLRLDQEERQRAEMIAMQMREDDAVDLAVIEPARLQRDRRRRAAIDQQRRLRGLQPEAGVEPAAGAEGIAAAYDGETHAQAPALGRADTSACQRRTFAHSSGTASFAGFMKSMAIMPVISATLYWSPAANGRFASSRSKIPRNSLDARLVGLGPCRHLRDFHLRHGRVAVAEDVGDRKQEVQLEPAIPHLDLRLLQRAPPEQRRLGMERLEIAADGDRFREYRAVVQYQRRHPLQRIDGGKGLAISAPAPRGRPAPGGPRCPFRPGTPAPGGDSAPGRRHRASSAFPSPALLTAVLATAAGF